LKMGDDYSDEEEGREAGIRDEKRGGRLRQRARELNGIMEKIGCLLAKRNI